MLDCNKCIKNDVCKIKNDVNTACKDLDLNDRFQVLVKNNVVVSFACSHFWGGEPKVLGVTQ